MSDAIAEFTKTGLPFDAVTALEALGKAESFVADQRANNQNIDANQDFTIAHVALRRPAGRSTPSRSPSPRPRRSWSKRWRRPRAA